MIMRKRLLMQLLVLACTVGAYAANVGDYLYTASAKYQITGANIFVNGNFSQGLDATWTNVFGDAVSGDAWGIETGLGPNGENVIVSKAAKADSLSWLHFVQPLSAGTYTFSYWVKSPSNVLTSIVATGTNSVRFFINQTGDATETTFIAGQSSYSTEWRQVVFTMDASDGDFLVFNANNIATDIMFTNFEIYPVVEVYDTRIAERLLKYWKSLYAEPDFTEQKDELIKPYIDALEELLSAGAVDATTMEGIQAEANAAVEAYLAANAGNLIGTTTGGVSTTRYLKDWTTITSTYINWNNMSTQGTWSFTGGRWGFASNVEDGATNDDGTVKTYLERPQEDGYVATAGIQTGYTLDVGLMMVTGDNNPFRNTSFKAGKYMFSIEAQAVAAANKAAPYGSNPGIEIAGPWMWVGTDTIAFRPVEAADAADHPTWSFKEEKTVLNDDNWQRLYVIGEIKEGEEVNAGFHFPVVGGGGRYSLRNPEFRAIGKSQETVDHLYAYDQLQVQQNALKERLDLANADNAKALEDGYPWGHTALTDSINKYTEVYNTLLSVVDATGAELQPEKVTLEYKDEILAAVQAMNRARNNFANTNKVFQKLKADIPVCNESLNDAANAAGDKATFKAVIDRAQAMVDATQYDMDQVDEFNAMDEELLNAKETFEMGTASRANPTEMRVKNGGFEAWTSSKTTYGSNQTNLNGWNITIGTDGKQWDIADNASYESGKNASIWRGTSVGPNGKMQQTRTLTKAGVYEYRAKGYASESGSGSHWDEYCAIANYAKIFDEELFADVPVDTLFMPNIRFFFGPNGAINDSITVTKCGPVDDYPEYFRNYPFTYSVIYVKPNDAEEEIEFGFEAFENGATAGACGFGFGDNHIYYVGSEAAYKAALKADYDAEVVKAKELIAKYPSTSWIANKFYKYFGEKIAGADYDPLFASWVKTPAEMSIQEMQNAYLSIVEYEKILEYVATYDPNATTISGVTEKVVPVRSGVYTITGAKVGNSINDLKSLGKGLYIVNGKKILVK